MAKIKSIKFYNYERTYRSSVMIAVRFYDKNRKLVILDFLNSSFSQTMNRCETDECIATGSIHEGIIGAAFHTGNYNKEIALSSGRFYTYAHIKGNNPEDFYKIEFKTPQYFSDIQINHNYYSDSGGWYGSARCDYDIEYEDGTIETETFESSSNLPPINGNDLYTSNYDQDVMDSMFESIDFNANKKIYDSGIGLIETLDTNNFRNIPVNSVEKLKVLYIKPESTYINCLVSFDQKQTWKTFNGNSWITISDISENNIVLNCMNISDLNNLDKNKLIAGGFTGDLDFKIAMKTNNENKTPSITKIYIKYK